MVHGMHWPKAKSKDLLLILVGYRTESPMVEKSLCRQSLSIDGCYKQYWFVRKEAKYYAPKRLIKHNGRIPFNILLQTRLMQVCFEKSLPPIHGRIRLNVSCFTIIRQQLLLKYSALHSYLPSFTEARLSRDLPF